MFKKILFATDDSVHSEKALPQLIDLAKTNNSEVIVFNVHYIPENLKSGSMAHYTNLEKMEKNLSEQGNKLVDEIKSKLENENIKVTTEVINGVIAPSIVKKAHDENCDLIIVGTRGMKNISNPLISSISNYVIHNAKCSVLLIH